MILLAKIGKKETDKLVALEKIFEKNVRCDWIFYDKFYFYFFWHIGSWMYLTFAKD